MSRFSLRLSSHNISESFEDSKSPKPFRYSVNPNLDTHNPYPSTSRSYVKHQKRIGQPLQSNLKLRKILLDKSVRYNSCERSGMSKDELAKFVEDSEKVEKIIDKFNEFQKISKFQNERMGFHEIKAEISEPGIDSIYLKTLSDSCSPRNISSEGQKLMQKARNLCKKKKEYIERSDLLKIEEMQGEKDTPIKIEPHTARVKSEYSENQIPKPDSKQLNSDFRFRHVNRKVLMLRTLGQIADNENKPHEPQTGKCKPDDKFINRKTPVSNTSRRPSVEGRASLLSCGILSPRLSTPIIDLKADSLNVCSIENIPPAKPDRVKPLRPEKLFKGDIRRTNRRNSVLSNTSIADGISEMPTQNTLIARSTTIHPLEMKKKVHSQKEISRDAKSSNFSSIFTSRTTRRMSTRRLIVPSKQTYDSNNESTKELNSNTSLDQNMGWQFITVSEVHKPSTIIQQLATSRNLSHRAAKKRPTIPKVACSKVKSLQSCLVVEPTSRKNSLTTREQQLNTLRKGPGFPVKVFDLLQKIHNRDSIRASRQCDESNETFQGSKLFGKAHGQSLNKTINESFEDKSNVSVVEETRSILNKYGYGNSRLALEPRESIKTHLELEKREDSVKAEKSRGVKSRPSLI